MNGKYICEVDFQLYLYIKVLLQEEWNHQHRKCLVNLRKLMLPTFSIRMGRKTVCWIRTMRRKRNVDNFLFFLAHFFFSFFFCYFYGNGNLQWEYLRISIQIKLVTAFKAMLCTNIYMNIPRYMCGKSFAALYHESSCRSEGTSKNNIKV